jgi:hypothetical protein
MANSADMALGANDSIRAQIIPGKGETITPPKQIIPNVTAARTVFFKFRSEHLKRIQLYALIEGLIAGNPPYNPADLSRSKLSHIANFNTLDARALYERSALAYWNALYESEYLIKFIITDPKNPQNKDPELIRYADIMAGHWTDLMRQWESYYTLVNTLAAQIVKFGISPAFWPDERDWRWRVVDVSKFYVTDQAQSDIGQMTTFCLETTLTAQYLMEVYNTFKDSPKESSPWNTDEVAKLLLWRANTWAKTDTMFIDVMDIQRRIQNGDIGWDAIFSDDIRLVSLFQKEYNGKISHYMFERYFDHMDFIYKAKDQYASVEEAMVLFTASPGEMTIHSNRGLGHKIFSAAQAMMQLDCCIVDMAKMSATPLVRSPATGVKDFEAIKFTSGVPTNLGSAEFVQNNLGANIEQLLAVSQYLLQKINYNAANSGDDPAMPDKDVGSVSPKQAVMESYREFGLPKNAMSHFYSQFDKVNRNMVVKALNSKPTYPGYETAKEWKDRCLADGVPKEVFELSKVDQYGMPSHLKARAARVAGDGSTLARLLGLQELQPLVPTFGPREAAEYKREYVMATMGSEYIQPFTQDSQDADEISGGASLAGVENAIMQNGQSPVFSKDNEHRSHAATHLALLVHTIQGQQQQQIDDIAADKLFSVAIPHTELHIKALKENPFAAEFLGKIDKTWKQVQQAAILTRKRAVEEIEAAKRKQMEDQAKTQEVMTDAQRKDFVAQADVQRADKKVSAQIDRAKEASDTRASIMQDSASSKADTARFSARAKAQNEAARNAVPQYAAEDKLNNTPLNDLSNELSDIQGVTPANTDFE